jgi:hypothetical protein
MNSQSDDPNELLTQIEKLEKQNEKLRFRLQKQKGKPSMFIGFGFICSGIVIVLLSVVYQLSVLMFIGLATTIWGSLLLFIRPVRYIRSILLDSAVLSSIEALDQLMRGLEYKGKAVYLPPRFLKELKGGQVFIPKNDVIIVPPMQGVEMQQVFAGNPNGIYLTPPGVELANLFEEELGKNFVEVSLDYLIENLPKAFIENLELAKNCEFSPQDSTITVKVTGVSYNALCERLCGKSKICNTIGCPFCSAIVCALTRTIGKPIVIDNNSYSSDSKTVNVQCKVLEG